MATESLSSIDFSLKNDYIGPLRIQLNQSTPAYSRLKKVEQIEVGGSTLQARIPLVYRRPQGIAWLAEGGTLPTATNAAGVQTTIPMAYFYSIIEMSGQAIAASRSNAYAFAKTVNNEIRLVLDEARVEQGRALWGDGSGALAKITQATGSVANDVTFTVDDASRVEEGMGVDTFTAKTGGSQDLTNVTVDVVDYINNKIAFSTTQTITQNDYIFRTGSRGNYPMGLLGIVDGANAAGTIVNVTTLQGINRTNNLWFQAGVIDNSGTNRTLTEPLIQQTFELGERRGGGMTSAIYSNYGVRRQYINLLIPDKRFAGLNMEGGWTYLTYAGGGKSVPWFADRFCPKNQAFFIDERTIQIYRASDFFWADMGGGSVLRLKQTADQYQAVLICYNNFGTDKPIANSVLRDITES